MVHERSVPSVSVPEIKKNLTKNRSNAVCGAEVGTQRPK